MNTENLFEKLRNEPDLYYAYQSNIAMAFKDEFTRIANCHETKIDKLYIVSGEMLHEIANDAAKNFLNLLIEPLE